MKLSDLEKLRAKGAKKRLDSSPSTRPLTSPGDSLAGFLIVAGGIFLLGCAAGRELERQERAVKGGLVPALEQGGGQRSPLADLWRGFGHEVPRKEHPRGRSSGRPDSAVTEKAGSLRQRTPRRGCLDGPGLSLSQAPRMPEPLPEPEELPPAEKRAAIPRWSARMVSDDMVSLAFEIEKARKTLKDT